MPIDNAKMLKFAPLNQTRDFVTKGLRDEKPRSLVDSQSRRQKDI